MVTTTFLNIPEYFGNIRSIILRETENVIHATKLKIRSPRTLELLSSWNCLIAGRASSLLCGILTDALSLSGISGFFSGSLVPSDCPIRRLSDRLTPDECPLCF